MSNVIIENDSPIALRSITGAIKAQGLIFNAIKDIVTVLQQLQT